MKTPSRYLLLLAGLIFELILATGCANTAHGVSADYHKAEDHVENAVK